MRNYNIPTQSNNALQLIPAAAKQPIRRAKPKTRNRLVEVRKSMRSSASFLRRTAHAMYVFGVFVVFGFCSCNSIVRDIYLAAQAALCNTVDESGGTVAAVVCCVIGLILGCATIFFGVILNSLAESISNDVKKLSKEV